MKNEYENSILHDNPPKQDYPSQPPDNPQHFAYPAPPPYYPAQSGYPSPPDYAPRTGNNVRYDASTQNVTLNRRQSSRLSFTRAIVLSAIVFFMCWGFFGLIAFVLAMIGAHDRSQSNARKLKISSYVVSIAGIIVGIGVLVAIVFTNVYNDKMRMLNHCSMDSDYCEKCLNMHSCGIRDGCYYCVKYRQD